MRRAETLATPHGPLPLYLSAPDAPPRGLVLLALLPGDPRVPVLESALLTAGMAVLTPHLLSAAELNFPDSVHNVPLLTERILHLLEFATKDGDTLDLPVGLYGTGPLTPAAVRAAARRDVQVRAVVCHGGIVDLAGLQYLETLSAPLLMVFAAEDDHGPTAFRRASTHLTCPWESAVLIPGALDAEPVTAWFARHLAPGVSSD